VSQPAVSIVVAVHNGQRYLAAAIESILRQTLHDFELLIVDDGSTDASARIAHEYATADSRVRVHTQSHQGVAVAFNLGGDQARAEHLAWLGGDDVAVRDRLRLQLAYMHAHPDVAVVGGSILVTDSELRPLLPVHFPTAPQSIRNTLRSGDAIAAPAAMMRTSVYRSVGGCRRAFTAAAEDYDLWLRIAEGHKLANLTDVLVYYRVHRQQATREKGRDLILSTVAAQVAARARSLGAVDPIDAVEHITYSTLLAAAPKKFVDSAILDAAAGQAIYLSLIGGSTEALQLLAWASGMVDGAPTSSRARARVALGRALIDWRSGRRIRALPAATAALANDPLLVMRAMVRQFRAKASPWGARRHGGVHSE
jgi:glycosyltransferase involved in cell wall biosynthesis